MNLIYLDFRKALKTFSKYSFIWDVILEHHNIQSNDNVEAH